MVDSCKLHRDSFEQFPESSAEMMEFQGGKEKHAATEWTDVAG